MSQKENPAPTFTYSIPEHENLKKEVQLQFRKAKNLGRPFYPNRMLITNIPPISSITYKTIINFIHGTMEYRTFEPGAVHIYINMLTDPTNPIQSLGACLVEIIGKQRDLQHGIKAHRFVNQIDNQLIHGHLVKCKLDQYNEHAIAYVDAWNASHNTNYVIKFGPPPRGQMVLRATEEECEKELIAKEGAKIQKEKSRKRDREEGKMPGSYDRFYDGKRSRLGWSSNRKI